MTNMTNTERDLVDTVLALTDIYSPEGVRIWLTGAHNGFDDRAPIDLIRNGEGTRVVTHAWQLADGAYA